tara:strand:- start:1531 stop:4008 length:2478 start_codon:yes stop_codon:yes gene_type:complete
MAIAKSSIEKINFTGGLITETTALTFPPNAAKELNNFELNRDGSIQRRLGMIEEPLGSRINTLRDANASSNHAITSYKWNNVDNDPTVTLGVVQLGNALWFTDLSADTLSTAMLNKDEFGVAQPLLLDTNVLPNTISGNEPISFTAIGGVLVIASTEMDHPLYLEYTRETPGVGDRVLRADTISIQVRDLWGPDDGLPVDERPEALLDDHKYNLQNQGWVGATNGHGGGGSGVWKSYQRQERNISLQELYPKHYKNGKLTIEDGDGFGGVLRRIKELNKIQERHGSPLDDGTRVVLTGVGTSGYPSNSDIRYTGNSTDENGDPYFKTSLLNIQGPSTTAAPKGRYIIDAFKRGQSRIDQTKIADLPLDEELGNVSVVATYANRLFYSGIASSIIEPDDISPDYTGCLFFSKSVENFSDFEKCHQNADPTEEDPLGLLATDGGFLKIAEASQITKLVVSRASLVVIAKNGIWEITGPDGVFKADDYSISQVTNIGCESPSSVIVAEDVVYYWSEGGVYALVADDISGKLNAQNISERTIQTFFNAIPATSKNVAKGRFDVVNRKITWMYNDSDDYNGINFKHSYNKELVLDTVLQAFYPREIGPSSDGTTIAAYLETENFVTVNDVQAVVVDGEQVVVNGEDVVVTIPTKGRSAGVTKYLMMTPNAASSNYGLSFGLYGGLDFKDWGEVDSPAYLTTGAELAQDTQRDKQVPYLTMHFNRSESGFAEVDGELEAVNPSSCSITSRWDFSNSAASGKWGRPFEAYRLPRNFIPQDVDDEFDYGYEVISSKTKLRGRGKSVSLKFETAPAKDCQIIGWGMPINGVTTV